MRVRDEVWGYWDWNDLSGCAWSTSTSHCAYSQENAQRRESFCLLEEDHLRPFSQQEFGETALIKQPPRAFLQKAQTQIWGSLQSTEGAALSKYFQGSWMGGGLWAWAHLCAVARCWLKAALTEGDLFVCGWGSPEGRNYFLFFCFCFEVWGRERIFKCRCLIVPVCPQGGRIAKSSLRPCERQKM